MSTPDADARSPSQPAAPLPRPPPPTLGGSASAVLAAPVEGKGAATSALTARSARRRGGSSTKTHVDDGLIAEARAHDATALARAMTAAAATSEFDSARLPKARDLIAQMRKSHASLRWNGSRLAPGESYKSGGFHLLCKWPSPLLYLICECQTPASRDARDASDAAASAPIADATRRQPFSRLLWCVSYIGAETDDAYETMLARHPRFLDLLTLYAARRPGEAAAFAAALDAVGGVAERAWPSPSDEPAEGLYLHLMRRTKEEFEVLAARADSLADSRGAEIARAMRAVAAPLGSGETGVLAYLGESKDVERRRRQHRDGPAAGGAAGAHLLFAAGDLLGVTVESLLVADCSTVEVRHASLVVVGTGGCCIKNNRRRVMWWWPGAQNARGERR